MVNSGFGMQDSGFGMWDLEFRIQGERVYTCNIQMLLAKQLLTIRFCSDWANLERIISQKRLKFKANIPCLSETFSKDKKNAIRKALVNKLAKRNSLSLITVFAFIIRRGEQRIQPI